MTAVHASARAADYRRQDPNAPEMRAMVSPPPAETGVGGDDRLPLALCERQVQTVVDQPPPSNTSKRLRGPAVRFAATAASTESLHQEYDQASKKHPEGHVRHGLRKCYRRRKTLTGHAGTIFEDSHLLLRH